MRRLASMVGISGPYLSQIERGLRAPSEAVLQAIADSLDVSVEALREQLDAAREEGKETETLAVLRRDRDLTAAQRQAMIEIYQAFLEVNAGRRGEPNRG